jgi:predicted GNAT family N-acyltransferase
MKIQIKHEQGLGPIHEDALAIRKAVFNVDNKLAATARVLAESDDTWHIQRVATLFPLRGQGLGRKLMEYIETLAPSYGIQNLVLGAQVQARGFYESLGFAAIGATFFEAGIQHIHMKKEL